MNLSESVREVAAEIPNSVENTRPREALRALVLLAEGSPIKTVAKTLSMSVNTVKALRGRHKQALSEARPELAAMFATVSGMALSGVLKLLEMAMDDHEMLKKWGPYNLTMIAAVATDKADSLDDRPTLRIEHSKRPSLDDVRKMHEEIQARCRGGKN